MVKIVSTDAKVYYLLVLLKCHAHAYTYTAELKLTVELRKDLSAVMISRLLSVGLLVLLLWFLAAAPLARSQCKSR